MSKAHKGALEETGRKRLLRLACAALLALMLPVMASAYTVVLRSGRRIQIPEKFTVTNLTLTYEAAPGINITILMSSIDIPATERANNEPAGSLLKRAGQVEGKATVSSGQTRRALTQADVEAGRRARQKSEQDYERRRKELGLPSLEESRQRAEEEAKRLSEASLQSQSEELQSEAYWRARASSLRTEMAALDAQINYIRARLSETPEYPSSLGAYTFIGGAAPIFPSRHAVNRFPVVVGNPGFMHGINSSGAQVGVGFAAFGGTTQGQIQLNTGIARGNVHQRGIFPQRIFAPTATVFGVPSSGYDYSYERANLISRLHELEAQRAGLQARWRLLEEEARRAGAQPGWLRP